MFFGFNMIRVDIRLLLMLAIVSSGGLVKGQRKPGGGSGGGSAPPPASTDYVDRNSDNSYRFGYNTGDEGSHFHVSSATADNSVTGRFGQREPGTGRLVQTTYTAGQRGFRARGDQVARRMDLSQQRIPYTPPVSPDSPNYQPTYSGYHDPNEDPSFEYSFQTPTFTKKETQDSKAEVTGSYTYVDDVGERHNVQYEAGPRTGFHVKTLYPDSTPYTGLFYRGAPANKQTGPLRGKTSIQRGTDGSYRFTATGPDQRRTEVSDAANNVRGSYTYLDDKGVQRTVQYIAGPNIGYKVIGGNKGLSPAGSSPGSSTGQFPYTPPDIETASPTSSAPPQKDSLNPSANLDEELFGPAPPGPLPSGEPEKQQQEIQGDPEDFLNTPLYGASGSGASPQYSEPSSTLAPALSPTPSPSPIPVSQLPQDFDDFLPPLSAFPEDDPSIPKPRPPGGGGGSPSYLTLEDNDFLKTPFALLPVGDSYDNSNYGGQFKRPKSNNNPNSNDNNRNVQINSRDRIQQTNNGMNKNHNNDNNNNNVYRTPPSAPGRDRPGFNNNNPKNNENNNYIPSTGRERESYSPPNPPPMRDRDNPPPTSFSPPPGSVGDNFFNTAPGRDNGFTIPPPSTPKDGFPLLNFGGDEDDFLPPLPGANDFPVPPAGGRIDYPPKERPSYFEGGRDRDREPSRRPYLHRDHKYSPSQKTFLGIPSGVAVRAHVQSLDILPFGSRIPPPGQALDYERRRQRRRRR